MNDQQLGSGFAKRGPISVSHVKMPSEMFAIADARIFTFAQLNPQVSTVNNMVCGDQGVGNGIRTPPHEKGYVVLSCDAHVEWISRPVLLNPTNSAVRWNNDHEPHPETWLP